MFESLGPSVMFCESLPNLEALTSIEVIAFCVKRGVIPEEVITSLTERGICTAVQRKNASS